LAISQYSFICNLPKRKTNDINKWNKKLRVRTKDQDVEDVAMFALSALHHGVGARKGGVTEMWWCSLIVRISVVNGPCGSSRTKREKHPLKDEGHE